MANKLKEASRETAAEKECRHYWIIDSAEGPVSRGVCKFCGTESNFSNSLPVAPYVKRNTDVFELPVLPELEPAGDDSKLEESNANL